MIESFIYPLLGQSISHDAYVDIDCSINHIGSQSVVDYETLDDFVNQIKKKADARVAIGGYLERRNLYQASDHFVNGPSRNIHLGVDLWIDAGAHVYAPMAGVIHSFAYNPAYLDYGYALILKHVHRGEVFFTLYGHLSSKYMSVWKRGMAIEAGSPIATIGDRHENGHWPPHLHFQMILDIGIYDGDYPGVCAEEDLTFYRRNCPDPSVLIKKGP